MEADWLRSRLESGRSIESIAREAGKHPSTVAYWVKKHGLESSHVIKHAPRGGIEREALEALLVEGLAIRGMAERLGLSYTTVRHWLDRHGLSTPRARRFGGNRTGTCRGRGDDRGLVSRARRHAVRAPRRRRIPVQAMSQRRRKQVKRILVAEAGGACALCGYDRSMAGLHFHHREPGGKSFGLASRGVTVSLAAARAEAAKCVLLCSNCHAEVEAGLASPP